MADGAVGQAGVEMAQAEMLGEPPAKRALAGGRRAVDGDDQWGGLQRHHTLRVMPPSMRMLWPVM